MSDGDTRGEVDHAMPLLVVRALERDPDAWDEIYRSRYGALYGFAHRRLLDARLAEDAVSETMTRALTAIDRFSWQPSGFDAWLFGIARNVVLEMVRAAPRIVDPVVMERVGASSPGPEEMAAAGDERRVMRAAFARLDPEERELLELRVCAELSSDDVGRLLGKRAGAVRMAQARALHRLRTFVEGVDRGE